MAWEEPSDKDQQDKIPVTGLYKAVEIITAAILILMAVYLVAAWKSLPDKLPMHYNAAGEIDRWSSKRELILLPVIAVFVYGLITLVSAFPSSWNIPVKVTRENRKRVYQGIKSMLVFMKLEVMVLFAYLELEIIHLRELPGAFLGTVLLLIFGTLAYYMLRLNRISKK